MTPFCDHIFLKDTLVRNSNL